MSNALTTTSAAKGLLSIVNAEADAFAAAANELGANIAGFFGFSGNTGEWKYKGQIIEHGSHIAINPEQMRKGYVCWKDGKPVDRLVEKILGGAKLPMKTELFDHGPYANKNDGWTELVELPVKFLDTGEEADISLSSAGGRNALLRLGSEWATKSKMNLDEDGNRKVAIVEIGAQGFKPKDAPGTKYAPVLKIVDWVSVAELSDHEGDYADEEAVEEAPAPAAAKPAAPVKAGGYRVPGKRV